VSVVVVCRRRLPVVVVLFPLGVAVAVALVLPVGVAVVALVLPPMGVVEMVAAVALVLPLVLPLGVVLAALLPVGVAVVVALVGVLVRHRLRLRPNRSSCTTPSLRRARLCASKRASC